MATAAADAKLAVVLAGGLGSRLRPYTVVLPKPLMPIGEQPILEVIVRQLAASGFDEVVLAVNHQAHLMKAYFGSGERLGLRVSYSLEEQALGTMGPLRLIPDLPENFLVMNGDVLCDLDFGAFYDEHVRRDSLFTISAATRTQVIDYGVLEREASGHLAGFREKPSTEYLVSMGVYAVSKAVVANIPADRPFGFDQLMLSMLSASERVYVAPHDGYWLDIGRPDDYHQAIEDWPRIMPKLKLG